MVKKFNSHKYNDEQILDAISCPVNRHCTRVEHNCDDWELHKHPEWLLDHYIRCGGAVEFAKRRVNAEYWMEEINADKRLEENPNKETPTRPTQVP